MAYWLMKSEPDVFSFDDLVAKTAKGEAEEWHGVRNYAARNNMREMAVGDEAFFYHSNIGKDIVGIMKIVMPAHPDSTAELNAKGEVQGKSLQWSDLRLQGHESYARMAGHRPAGEIVPVACP